MQQHRRPPSPQLEAFLHLVGILSAPEVKRLHGRFQERGRVVVVGDRKHVVKEVEDLRKGYSNSEDEGLDVEVRTTVELYHPPN